MKRLEWKFVAERVDRGDEVLVPSSPTSFDLVTNGRYDCWRFDQRREKRYPICGGEVAEYCRIEKDRLRLLVVHLFVETACDVYLVRQLVVRSGAVQRRESGVFEHRLEFPASHVRLFGGLPERNLPESVPTDRCGEFVTRR